ncbi:unnamed protein product, partial [Staurois parvus]
LPPPPLSLSPSLPPSSLSPPPSLSTPPLSLPPSLSLSLSPLLSLSTPPPLSPPPLSLSPLLISPPLSLYIVHRSDPTRCPAFTVYFAPVVCPHSLVISCTVSAVSGHLLYCVRS